MVSVIFLGTTPTYFPNSLLQQSSVHKKRASSNALQNIGNNQQMLDVMYLAVLISRKIYNIAIPWWKNPCSSFKQNQTRFFNLISPFVYVEKEEQDSRMSYNLFLSKPPACSILAESIAIPKHHFYISLIYDISCLLREMGSITYLTNLKKTSSS